MKFGLEINRIKELVAELNIYQEEYYNLSWPAVSDQDYDRLFDELQALELKTGFVLGNSPTQTVGYKAVENLKKVKHRRPLLSLDKTKSMDDLLKFLKKASSLFMLKLDGLT